MSSKKRKFWKIPLFGLCVVGGVVLWLGFGDQGFINLYRTEKEYVAYEARIRRLTDENQGLLEEVYRLRSDLKYVESVARKELNLIKENEIMFRFPKEEPVNKPNMKISQEAEQGNGKMRSDVEVGYDGRKR